MTIMIPAWVDGDLTPVEKLDVHKRGLRHKAVSVFAMDGDNVLIQQRAMSKYHTPGLWANTCCTHPEWNESSADCAIRRVREELGITGLTPVFRDQVEYRADVGGGLIEHEVVDVFVMPDAGQTRVTPNPDEVMATKWVNLYDLTAEVKRRPEKFSPWLKIYLEQYMDRIFASLVRA